MQKSPLDRHSTYKQHNTNKTARYITATEWVMLHSGFNKKKKDTELGVDLLFRGVESSQLRWFGHLRGVPGTSIWVYDWG